MARQNERVRWRSTSTRFSNSECISFQDLSKSDEGELFVVPGEKGCQLKSDVDAASPAVRCCLLVQASTSKPQYS